MPSTSENNKERFNRWAATYDQSVWQRWFFGPVHSKMLEVLDRQKPTGPRLDIMDVGCGTGRLLRAAAARWPQARFMGIDPAEQMISKARQSNPGAIFKVASAESIPFPDQSADLVLSSLSFHHWTDQRKSLQEIGRVLRPGGWFCLADHTVRLSNVFHEKARNLHQIRALMKDAGLTVVLSQRMRTRFILITLAQK